MLAKPCTFDYWRNYKPEVKNLVFDVDYGKDVEIPLSILLGARDEKTGHSPTLGVLDKVPAQRGWRFSLLKMSDPLRGDLRLNVFNDTFIYSPRSSDTNFADCFSYAVTNGTQQSDTATITLNLRRHYWYKLQVRRLNSTKTKHKIDASLWIDGVVQNGNGTVLLRDLSWYYNQYRAVRDASGVIRIKKERIKFYGTVLDWTLYNAQRSSAPTTIDRGESFTIDTYFDNTLGGGLDGDFDRPFVPLNSQGDIELEVKLYLDYNKPENQQGTMLQVDVSKYLTLNYKLSDVYGVKWWDSGNILV